MILKLKPNSSTFIIWNSKPQVSNQLSGKTAINNALWNTTCSFPTLSDFCYLKSTRSNLSCFSWFSPRDIWKKHYGKKKIATLTGLSFAHIHKAEWAVNLSLGRSLINISKFSFPPFKLQNNPWNNVGTRRTKKSSLEGCSYAATQPWLVLCHYLVTSCLTANWPQICMLSGRKYGARDKTWDIS